MAMNSPPAKKKNWAGKIIRVILIALLRRAGSFIPGATIAINSGVKMKAMIISSNKRIPKHVRIMEKASQPFSSSFVAR
jgi:uncharacterized protein YjhX (UPF0386 family)